MLLAADVLKAAIVEHPLDRLPLAGGAVIDGVDDGERGLAFAQIAGDRLAQDLFGRGQIENVIDNLEGEADRAAIGCKVVLPAASVAPASTAPRRMETENRQAVLRKIRS